MKNLFLILSITILISFIYSCSSETPAQSKTKPYKHKTSDRIKLASKKMPQDFIKGRAISLRVFQKRTKECMARGNCPENILQLSGITKVVGYVIDEKNKDLLLIGKVEDKMPLLYLEDFVIALRNTWNEYVKLKGDTRYYEYPGCSIDMTRKVNKALEKYKITYNERINYLMEKGKVNEREFKKRERVITGKLRKYEKKVMKLKGKLKGLQKNAGSSERARQQYNKTVKDHNAAVKNYNAVAEEHQALVKYYNEKIENINKERKDVLKDFFSNWKKTCPEPQIVKVFGMPHNRRFSKIMVEADYLMKRLVDGSVELDIEGFKSLTMMREELNVRETDEINKNRFWFLPGENSYIEDKGIVLIKMSEVLLDTRKQVLTESYELTDDKGKIDPISKEFAEIFSVKYDEIAGKEPIYKELEGLFRFVSLAKLLKYKGAFSEAGLDIDYLIKSFRIDETLVDRRKQGIGPYNITQITCGGVDISIEGSSEKFMGDFRFRERAKCMI